MSLQGWLFWFLSLCVKLCDDITRRKKAIYSMDIYMLWEMWSFGSINAKISHLILNIFSM